MDRKTSRKKERTKVIKKNLYRRRIGKERRKGENREEDEEEDVKRERLNMETAGGQDE